MATASEKLAKMVALGPLEVSVEELEQVIQEAEAEGVEAKRITRAKKKVAYAIKAQKIKADYDKNWEEMNKPTLADSYELLESQFGYHAFINYDYNIKKLGTQVLKM